MLQLFHQNQLNFLLIGLAKKRIKIIFQQFVIDLSRWFYSKYADGEKLEMQLIFVQFKYRNTVQEIIFKCWSPFETNTTNKLKFIYHLAITFTYLCVKILTNFKE